jgi:hypothetical protein
MPRSNSLAHVKRVITHHPDIVLVAVRRCRVRCGYDTGMNRVYHAAVSPTRVHTRYGRSQLRRRCLMAAAASSCSTAGRHQIAT